MSVIFDALRELDHEKSIDSREGLADIGDKGRHGFSTWSRGVLWCLMLGGTSIVSFVVWENYSKQVSKVAVKEDVQIKIAPLVNAKSIDQGVEVAQAVTAEGLKEPILTEVNADKKVVSAPSERLSQLMTKATMQAVEHPLLKQAATNTKPMAVAVANEPRVRAVKKITAVSTARATVKVRRHSVVKQEKKAFQKQHNISKLIPQLQLAMAQKNETLVIQYLDELASISGSESIFVNKMRAYWALSNGSFDEALSRYQSIIAQKPDDIESQLNAALAEIQLKHFENAHKRLAMLASKYPNDARISSMQSQLKAINPL